MLVLLVLSLVTNTRAIVANAVTSPTASLLVPILVKFAPSATAQQVDDASRTGGGTVARDLGQIRTRVINVPAAARDQILATLAVHAGVERAAAAIKVAKSGDPNDAGYSQQWALPKIAWDTAYSSVPIAGSAKIAVLDTGVDATHPDLVGRVVVGQSFTGGVPNVDPNGHGTALAGIAAASVNNSVGMAGVAYAGTSVSSVQVLQADGTGWDSDVVSGVLWAADNGAQVILMGFSSAGYSSALADALAYAWSKGAVLVAATGNDGSGAASYPAGMANVIGVAATDQNDAVSASSNTGSASVAAPGVAIYATLVGGGYGTTTGTSASAAEAAGLAALLVASGKSNLETWTQIRGATDPVAGASFGRINVAKALGAAVTAPPPTATPTPTPTTAPTYVGGTNPHFDITAPAPVAESNSATVDAIFNVQLSGAGPSGTFTVQYATGAVTATAGTTCATAGTDYLTTSGTLTFNSGNGTQQVIVKVCGDTLDEANETFNVTLSNPTGGSATIQAGTATATITDDDGPSISVNDVTVAEGNSGTTLATFTVTLSAASPQQVTVSYATANGTATAPSDYVAINATTLSFAPGDTSKPISVSVKGDTVVEPNETFFVNLSSPTNATIADGQGQGTITNDDNSPPVAVNDAYSTAEDTTLTVVAPGVLTNDTDANGNSLTAVLGVGPIHGSLTLNSNGSFSYTPAANYNGSDGFTYKANDGALDSNTATVALTINPVNDAPVAVNDAYTTDEDTLLTVAAPGVLANDSDIDSATITAVLVSGPLHAASFTLNADGSFSYTPAPDYNGADSFTYKANDGALDSNTATVALTINPVNDAPVVDAGPNASINEGGTFTSSGSFTDPDNDIWTATVDYGDGTGIQPLTLTGKTFGLNHTYTDNGTFTVTVTVNDHNGGIGSDTAVVTVANVAPSNVNLTAAPATINENDSISLTGSFSDPGTRDTHTVTITWGDGSPATTLTLAAGVTTFTASHQYLDDNPTGTASDVNTITATVTDNAGATGTGTTTVTVNNVAPVITTITGPTGPLAIQSTVSITANFTDIGTLDTHTCTFHWDDGTPDTTVTAAGSGSGSCTATHKYGMSDIYTVTVTVTDDDTGSTTRTYESFVVIYDANNGFVTGGGWITSPPGAYATNPTLTGKATFGFVSQYKKGATVPTGNTEFQFQVGNLNFNSTAYEWLVISGARAQYKGSGTINGSGNYGFLLTAVDGQVTGGGGIDKFRIKIWNSTPTGDVVVYDNQMGAPEDSSSSTALGGGSITIHK
ncbi:MAG: Ig-like domain-containing protein [Chloroflexota bacterium]|nr:Ig-like domain-containing protein [Chloroflexota bacterium]